MKFYRELDLTQFEAWSGAESTMQRICAEGKAGELEDMLEELYPDGMSEDDLNDLLRFEADTVFGWLGMKTDEELAAEEAEAEEEREKAKEAENFYEFCGSFSDCEHCPLLERTGPCEELWVQWKEENAG